MQMIKNALQEVDEQETHNKLTTLKPTENQDTQQNTNFNNLKTNIENENEDENDEQEYLPTNKKTVIKWLYTHFNNKSKLKSLKKLSFLDSLRKETGDEVSQQNNGQKHKNINKKKLPNQTQNDEDNQQNEDQYSQKNDQIDKQKISKGIENQSQEYTPHELEDQEAGLNVNDHIIQAFHHFLIS